ncbi:MAG: type II toxin-antitoxin system VapB family antitoxin [Planctomycetes bacterium]|jgi:Arc/MetJ family transcription regulator|nr:type II toxin-antitoxin system VapB family antitoxin [Planctomycetota bacterium]MCL4731402.1 type II toxin-antitoxin system VapB family antitoxin [Planctomycetota bacterium]
MPTNLALDDKVIAEAVKVGGHKTKREAVMAALIEYIRRHKQREIIKLFGTVEFDQNWNYKAERKRKRA